MIEIGERSALTRLKNGKKLGGQSPVNEPLDETLLRRNNRQLSSSPVFIINDGLPRSKSSRQNSLSFEKFPSNTAAILSWSRSLTMRLVPSPLLPPLHRKIVRGERNRGKERGEKASHDFMGKIRLTLCLSSSPPPFDPFSLRFHLLASTRTN